MSAICFLRFIRSLACRITLPMCAAMLAGHSLHAGETPAEKSTASAATEEESAESTNWIELGIGGLIINGDAAQFKQEHRMSGDVFGGIEDLHYEQTVGKKGLFLIDGHAIFDNDDYDVRVELSQPGLGYIRGGYTEFRSWYDGNGGFFPVNGQFFAPPHPEMALDRGEAWIELGLRVPKLPEITLRYSHLFRDGRKDSTIWGDTSLTGLALNPARKIAPAFRDINETRDIFALDIVQNFGKTDLGLGMRYEHSEIDNRLQLERGAGELPPLVTAPGAQRFITQNDKNSLDTFNGRFTTETRFSDALWFTTAYSYTTLGSDLAGTRIIGTDYNASFSDPILTLRPFDHGFLNLAGQSQVDQHVVNLNLMWVPLKNLTVLSAFRYTHEDKDSASTFLETSTSSTPPIEQLPPVLTAADSLEDFNKFSERLELRYTGIAKWLFYAEGEWEEEFGDILERQAVEGEEPEAVEKKLNLLWQKYTTGANWYPLDRLNLSAQYYHKILQYDNQSTADHQSLVNQKWNTDDVNVRVTWRPRVPPALGTLSLVSRYDFIRASVEGQWELPGEETFSAERTALITNHMITESITWNPSARLYVQGNFSYVLNKTDTPADYSLTPNTTPTVLDFTSDYWTASGAAGYALDQKTDLRAEYSYYRADNYVNNALVAVPYGMGATEHTVSAGVSRQIARNIRLKLQYSYFNYTDQASGGHNNYEAHSLFSSLQFRF